MKQRITLADGRQVTVQFNSWLARAVKPGGINNCVTLSAGRIRVSRDWVTARGLAHEVGHTYQAEARGIWYLPWVLIGYLRHGYARSPAEVDADRYMDAHVQDFTALGPVPAWAR